MSTRSPCPAADDLEGVVLRAPSFWHSRAAARALLAQGTPVEALLPALAEALRDPNPRTRRRAVRLLGLLRRTNAALVPLLRGALGDADWPVRRAAARALGDQGPVAVTARADLSATLVDPVSGVRAAAAEALRKLAGYLAPEEVGTVAALLAARLDDADESVREMAFSALNGLEVGADVLLPACRAALRDESGAVRLQAVRTIAAEEDLLHALGDGERVVRAAAVEGLGRVGALDAVAALIPLLADADLRGEAAQALASIGGRAPVVEARLTEAWREGPHGMRAGASQALALLGSSAALEEFRRLAREGDLSSRRRAVRALGWFTGRPADVVADLEAALRDSHGRIRRTAAEALGNLGSGAAPVLAGLLRRLHDHEPRVRAACAIALARILPGLAPGDREWLRVLATPARGPGQSLRRALARPDLGSEVGDEFRATCVRRAAWHAGHAGAAASLPATASAWQAARAAAAWAGRKASRKVEGREEQRAVARAARTSEHAWQLGRLWALQVETRGERTA